MNEKIKCSKDNPCLECQKELQENLANCEGWETKRKEYLKSWFPYHSNGNNYGYVETGGYNYHSVPCPSCQAVIKIIKSNNHGDQTEELKEHAHTTNCQSHSAQSNQIQCRVIPIKPITYLGF